VVAIHRNATAFEYLEEYPVGVLAELETQTGRKAPSGLFVIIMEYGRNFSGADKDVFYYNRAVGEAQHAWQSNFLHPVIYYYKRLPTGKLSWILPDMSKTERREDASEPKQGGGYPKALHTLLHFLRARPLGRPPPPCALKKKLGVGKKFLSVRLIRGGEWGAVVPETLQVRTGTNACWEFPRSQKEEHCSPLAGTLHAFCRVPADEAGWFCVAARSKLLSLAGPGLRGPAVTEAAKGKGLRISVTPSEQTLRTDFLGK